MPCANDVAEALVRDDRFATLSFTGSAKVGWALKALAGKKRVLLELGGNAAAIVHEDADRAWALERIVAGAFGYAGQVCIKVQRLYVHAPIADAFVARARRARERDRPREPARRRDARRADDRRGEREARRGVGGRGARGRAGGALRRRRATGRATRRP